MKKAVLRKLREISENVINEGKTNKVDETTKTVLNEAKSKKRKKKEDK